jgi:hypothetical protein
VLDARARWLLVAAALGGGLVGSRLLSLVEDGDQALAIHPQDVMAMIDFLQHGVQLPAHAHVLPDAEDLRDRVGG